MNTVIEHLKKRIEIMDDVVKDSATECPRYNQERKECHQAVVLLKAAAKVSREELIKFLYAGILVRKTDDDKWEKLARFILALPSSEDKKGATDTAENPTGISIHNESDSKFNGSIPAIKEMAKSIEQSSNNYWLNQYNKRVALEKEIKSLKTKLAEIPLVTSEQGEPDESEKKEESEET